MRKRGLFPFLAYILRHYAEEGDFPLTLTIDGKLIQLHPVVVAMIAVLIEKQEGIWRRGTGSVTLDFAPQGVALKVYDPPIFTGYKKTTEAKRPSLDN